MVRSTEYTNPTRLVDRVYEHGMNGRVYKYYPGKLKEQFRSGYMEFSFSNSTEVYGECTLTITKTHKYFGLLKRKVPYVRSFLGSDMGWVELHDDGSQTAPSVVMQKSLTYFWKRKLGVE